MMGIPRPAIVPSLPPQPGEIIDLRAPTVLSAFGSFPAFMELQMRAMRRGLGLAEDLSWIDPAGALDVTAPETFERWIAADTDLTLEEWSAPARIRCLKCSGPAAAQSNYCARHSTGARC
jgi:hypothetical protein